MKIQRVEVDTLDEETLAWYEDSNKISAIVAISLLITLITLLLWAVKNGY